MLHSYKLAEAFIWKSKIALDQGTLFPRRYEQDFGA